jgi:hypothetical protein
LIAWAVDSIDWNKVLYAIRTYSCLDFKYD